MRRPFLFAAVLLCVLVRFNPADGAGFEPVPLQIADYGLFDLGVADANDDGFLDIFTANHSGVQSVLLNSGSGTFTDAYSEWKMDQDTQFPGLAIHPREPAPSQSGVYINWVGPDVVVRFHDLKPEAQVQGSIDVLTSVQILSRQDVDVDVSSSKVNPELDRTTVRFTGRRNGFFRFRPYNHALPFNFTFGDAVAPESIYVGRQKVSPPLRSFSFQLRDRHGMAWADATNDRKIDVFITRGGERDTMSKMPLSFWDELLVGAAGCMEDSGKPAGLEKKGCPGRQAAWVDFDNDNLLDIYVVCGRGKNPHPNMLFKQSADGKFTDVAAQVGLGIESNGPFVWLDAERDGDMDLFWVDGSGVFLYRNQNGAFIPARIELREPKSGGLKLAVADYDNDGDLDVFLTAFPQSSLFVNDQGRFSEVAPESLGLPEKSFTANWVDVDNDGRMDLHALPQGLYIQNRQGQFSLEPRAAVTLSSYSPYRMVDARASWFDLDNDGRRDVVMSTEWGKKKSRLWNLYFKLFDEDPRFGGLDTYWETALLKNTQNHHHWLQVDLSGPQGNRQAIGAFVTLKTPSGQQCQQVGWADGAHYSQGHYRLYFGLGQEATVSSLRIDWPDGVSSEVAGPAADRLLKIVYGENTPSS